MIGDRLGHPADVDKRDQVLCLEQRPGTSEEPPENVTSSLVIPVAHMWELNSPSYSFAFDDLLCPFEPRSLKISGQVKYIEHFFTATTLE